MKKIFAIFLLAGLIFGGLALFIDKAEATSCGQGAGVCLDQYDCPTGGEISETISSCGTGEVCCGNNVVGTNPPVANDCTGDPNKKNAFCESGDTSSYTGKTCQGGFTECGSGEKCCWDKESNNSSGSSSGGSCSVNGKQGFCTTGSCAGQSYAGGGCGSGEKCCVNISCSQGGLSGFCIKTTPNTSRCQEVVPDFNGCPSEISNCCLFPNQGGGQGNTGAGGAGGILIPTNTGLPNPDGPKGPVLNVLSFILSWLMRIFMLFAVASFVITGFQYIFALGNDISQAKRNFQYSLIAVAVVGGAMVIIRTIDYLLQAEVQFLF